MPLPPSPLLLLRPARGCGVSPPLSPPLRSARGCAVSLPPSPPLEVGVLLGQGACGCSCCGVGRGTFPELFEKVFVVPGPSRIQQRLSRCPVPVVGLFNPTARPAVAGLPPMLLSAAAASAPTRPLLLPVSPSLPAPSPSLSLFPTASGPCPLVPASASCCSSSSSLHPSPSGAIALPAAVREP